MKIAFVGIGNMGAPMARNLLRAGHDVTVFNRTGKKAEALAAAGAHVADSPAAAARGADVVVTMLANDAAVADVVHGDGGLLGAMPLASVHMGCSTISVELARHLAASHAVAGQGYISAPVLGRPEAADAARLWIIAAGAPDLVARCRPLMQAMGRGISVVGEEPAQANLVKIAANFTIASLIETLGEAFALLRKGGIAPRQFLEVANTLFGSPVFGIYGDIIADEKYEPAGFRMKLGLKDINLALAAADAQAVPMPLAALIHDHFLEGIARGWGDRDWSALAQVVASNAGLESTLKAGG